MDVEGHVSPSGNRYRSKVDSWLPAILIGAFLITLTRNPLSSPALSLDRLQVDYIQGNMRRSVLISPKDKTGFLNDLAANAGDLELQGDRLVLR